MIDKFNPFKERILQYFPEGFGIRANDWVFLRNRSGLAYISSAHKIINEIRRLIFHLPTKQDIADQRDVSKLRNLVRDLFSMKSALESATTATNVGFSSSDDRLIQNIHIYAIKHLILKKYNQIDEGENILGPESEFRKEFLLQKNCVELEETFNLLPCATMEEKINFINDLIKELSLDAEVIPTTLPIRAPELWKNRYKRFDANNKTNEENPIQFFARVYEPWLDKGMSRAYIRTIDSELYMAIARSLNLDANRLSHFPQNVRNALRTKAERIDAELAEYKTVDNATGDMSWAERQRLGRAAKRRGENERKS